MVLRSDLMSMRVREKAFSSAAGLNSTNELMTKHEMITRKFIELSRRWTSERTSDVGKGRKKGVSALTWELRESNTASQF